MLNNNNNKKITETPLIPHLSSSGMGHGLIALLG
jgi:hypothetical protein